MSRWIKEDALITALGRLLEEWGITLFGRGGKELATIIAHQAPNINVVRCGECRYWHKNRKDGDDIPVHDACYDFTDDDFCSYGVRIDEYEKEYRELGLGKLKALRQTEREGE